MAVWPTIVDYSTVLNKALFDSIQTYVDAVPSSLADGSAASPALRFTSDPNTGIYSNGADSIGFATNGTLRWYVNNNGHLAATGVGSYDIGITNQFPRNILFGGTLTAVGNVGTTTLDLNIVNSTAANGVLVQATRVRGTLATYLPVLSGDTVFICRGRGWHSGSGYSSPGAIISFTASEDFTSTANGMAINFATAAIGTTSAATRWTINNAGHLLAGADNSYDIGASGATRPRAIYVAGGVTVGSTTLLTTSASLTDGAAAQTGTLTNAPAAGNPTKWVPINDNGITRYIPAW